MGKCFVSVLPDGRVAITKFLDDNPTRVKIARTMFELSRDERNTKEHFNSEVHTLDAIASGLPGHCPLRCHEHDDSEIPQDRTRRNEWKYFWRDGQRTVGISDRLAELVDALSP